MSHPLMVEAIEDLFIPVLVYNNKPEDEAKLKHFNEPSWNNPIVRYFDSDTKDIIPRESNVWSLTATAQRMVKALAAANREVPPYLRLLASSDPQAKTERVEFAML